MKKEVKIIIAVVVALLILGLIYFVLTKSQTQPETSPGNTASLGKAMTQTATQTPAAVQATKQLINEVAQNGTSSMMTISVPVTGMKDESGMEISTTTEIKVVTIAPGTSAINVSNGQVVNQTGQPVDNSAIAGSGAAPQESFPVSVSDLPSSAVKLEVTSSSFTPKQFTVNSGQAVSLAVTNANTTTFSEVFRFDDPSLAGVVVGLAKGETKAVTFNAPTKAGSYTFYSDMFNHREMGATGTMIVK